MMYSETDVETCPIYDKLGGTWEQLSYAKDGVNITSGFFLCAANSSSDDKLYYRGTAGGNANAVNIAHSHNISTESLTTSEDGSHSHNFRHHATAHDGTEDDCFRSAKSTKNGKILIEESNASSNLQQIRSSGLHSHTISLSSLEIQNAGEDGTNKNLPPYLAVYM